MREIVEHNGLKLMKVGTDNNGVTTFLVQPKDAVYIPIKSNVATQLEIKAANKAQKAIDVAAKKVNELKALGCIPSAFQKYTEWTLIGAVPIPVMNKILSKFETEEDGIQFRIVGWK